MNGLATCDADLFKFINSRWLNQPIWINMRKSNWKTFFPNFGVIFFQKYLSCHHRSVMHRMWNSTSSRPGLAAGSPAGADGVAPCHLPINPVTGTKIDGRIYVNLKKIPHRWFILYIICLVKENTLVFCCSIPYPTLKILQYKEKK